MVRVALQLLMIFISSILLGIAYNFFLIPDQILSGGITGVAMIVGQLFPVNIGLLIFLFNVPIFVFGYFKLGKKFIAYSIFSVATTTVAMQYIPMYTVTRDHLLAAVYGGVIGGIAIGFIFRATGSTGGFDIISLIIRRKRDIPIGSLSFILNALVIIVAGFAFGWEIALYTILSFYATGKVIDLIHTTHLKVTLMIISAKSDEIKQQLLSNFTRGLTIWEAEGAFTHQKRGVIMMVTTRFELSDVRAFILKIDPSAFVNITPTIDVIGSFRRDN